MLRLLFLSSTSVLVAASGCSDDSCGPASGTQDAGLLASSAEVVLNYGNLTSGPNNDCPDPEAPMGVVSLTLEGKQIDGPGLLTLCIGRPDLLQTGELPLGGSTVRIIDLNGTVGDCDYEFESLRPVTGTVASQGLCDNGQNLAGYAITVDASLSLRRMCPTVSDTIAVSFAGTVSLEATP
jgi:hypothetical protein